MSRINLDLIIDQPVSCDDSLVKIFGIFHLVRKRDRLIRDRGFENFDLGSIPDDFLFSWAGDAVEFHDLSGLERKRLIATAQEGTAIIRSHPDYLPLRI